MRSTSATRTCAPRARTWRCARSSAYNAYLLSLEQVRVAEKVVHQKEKQLEMAKNRRVAGVATELEVLRFEVDLANERTTLLRLRGATDLAPGT